MIQSIFILFGLLIIIYLFLAFFILYHLTKYSINSSLNSIAIPLFIIVSSLLFISNIVLFLSINWNDVLFNFFN